MYTHTARAATREGLSVTAHESRAAKAKVVISSDPMRAKPGRKSTARYTLEHKHPSLGQGRARVRSPALQLAARMQAKGNP